VLVTVPVPPDGQDDETSEVWVTVMVDADALTVTVDADALTVTMDDTVEVTVTGRHCDDVGVLHGGLSQCSEPGEALVSPARATKDNEAQWSFMPALVSYHPLRSDWCFISKNQLAGNE